MLPDFDGVSLVKKIIQSSVELNLKARLYMFTAEDSEHIRKQSMDAGVDGFIAKPIQKQDFLDAIKF